MEWFDLEIKESGENYLETILLLYKKNGLVRSIDIANELEYSKPSISRAMSILKEAGYIVMEKSGLINLTEEGMKKAGEVYERHECVTNYLMNALGVGRRTAEKDACRIEHIISDETFEKIKEYMDAIK